MKNTTLLLLCLLFFGTITAQEDNEDRPKIGVVLSGGGAKGLAHIGVLKVLEEAGIKVDYIGGTSMGAIVGGLYAAGHSAQELDSIFNSLDADALIQDFTPRGSKSFFEKRNDELYAITLPFKGFKLGIPTAISKGLYNYTTVNRLTDNVRHIRDFSCLPIPFVCIATDVETGEEIVLNQGVLADAILASGAFPSLYYPVEIEGRLLIDGGVTNNYPVEEVRKMGADIIIGVDVQDGLKDRNQIKGATGILVQINNYQMIKKMDAKRKATDIYIKPDISDYTVISFDEGRDIIDEGEKSARMILEQLKTLGVGEPLERETVKIADSINVEAISINGNENYTRAYVIGKLNFKPGTKISYSKFNRGISNLNATQNFTTISYNFTEGDYEDEGDVLNLNLKENPINRYLKFGMHYDGLYKSGVLVNVTQKNALWRNDVISADVILGDNFRYMFNYFMDNGFYLSYGLRSWLYGFNRNINSDFIDQGLTIRSLNVDFTDITHQAYVQTIFAQKFMLGGGAEYKHLKIKSETVGTANVFDDSDYVSAYGYIKIDSYDNRYYPNEGWYFEGEAKWYLYSSDYTGEFDRFSILKAHAGKAISFGHNLTVELEAETGLTIGEETIGFFDFVLGGYGFHSIDNIRPFFGYDFLSVSGNSYLKGKATLDWEFYKKHHINATADYANIGDRLFEEGEILSIPQFSGYAVGYGMETIIGPIEIKHSWSPETDKHYTWFSVGYRF